MPVVRQQDDVPSEFAKFGQMLLDGKSGKVPTIWQLKFLKDLKTFRIAYEKYTREVKTYNMTHALAIKVHPVIACPGMCRTGPVDFNKSANAERKTSHRGRGGT